MRRVRHTAVMLSVAAVLLAGCAGDDGVGEEGAAQELADSSTSAQERGGQTTPVPDEGPVPFEVPAERFAMLESMGLAFEQVEYPAQPDGVSWPTQAWPTGEPDVADAEALEAALELAFDDDTAAGGTIHAVLVVQGGRLVVEQYNDWDPDTAHNSWSMAKSMTQALVGVLVGEERMDVLAPALVPEWSDPDDPRSQITLDQLLRMSSGLAWEENYADPEGDVLSILVGSATDDRAAYAAAKPLIDEPDTALFYSTGTSNIVARVIADEVGYGDDLTAWIDEVLFDPLGITSAEHDLDGVGVINAGSWINMTAQDFARFGLLYLRDGVWDGERLLPQGWVDYGRMPTTSADNGIYGAHWWVEDLRPGMFRASGFQGQSITVVPDTDLVVVVLSELLGGRDLQVRDGVVEAFAGSR